MTGAALDSPIEELFARPAEEGLSLALVISRRGEILAERYGVQPADDFQPETAIGAASTLISWSMAKSITHAAVGVLVRDGVIDVDAPAPVPEWEGTPKAAITLLDLLEMRSGLHFVEDYVDGDVSNCLEMLYGDSGPSHAAYAAAQPLIAPPGTRWNYSSGTTNIISRIIGDVVRGAPGGSPEERKSAMERFLRDRVFTPAGMDSAVPKFDGAGDFVGSSYVYATARHFARFGELYLRDGAGVDGTQALPTGWADHARRRVATDPETGYDYGRHWWLWPELPGSLVGQGYEGQRTIVVPDRELVLVHLGKTPIEAAPQVDERLRAIVGRC